MWWCRDADDNFYDRTEGAQRQKHVVPEALDAATLLGQKVCLCCAMLRCAALCCGALWCAALCCAVLCCAVLCCAVLCCAVLGSLAWLVLCHAAVLCPCCIF